MGAGGQLPLPAFPHKQIIVSTEFLENMTSKTPVLTVHSF